MPARALVGAALGALLALALSIAYDTSSATAALEQGHGHLTFRAILVFAVIGAAVGAALAGGFSRGRVNRPL